MRGSSGCRRRPTRARTSKSLLKTSRLPRSRPEPLPSRGTRLSKGSARAATPAGLALGVLTFAAYMIGSNRSFGYDAAATFANFIATPSIWDAFAVRSVIPTIPITQVATNDHVLMSLLSHVIFSLTGSRSEAVYRVLPALAGAATVSVSSVALSKRFGLLAGLCAGVFIATNPLFVDNSRDLRVYSLAALGSVVGTLILAAGVGVRARGEVAAEAPRRGRLVAYAIVMGLAIAAQLFAGVVLLCHVAWIATRRSRSDLVRWIPAWAGAALIGAAANAGIYILELAGHGLPPPYFNQDFPLLLALFLFGAPVLLPIGLWLATAILGIWTQRSEPWLWTTIAVVAVVVAALWLGLRPAFLYPRFFVFLVPAIGYLIASAVQRWWVVLPPVVVAGAAAATVGQAPTYTQNPLALPQAAAAIERIH